MEYLLVPKNQTKTSFYEEEFYKLFPKLDSSSVSISYPANLQFLKDQLFISFTDFIFNITL